MSEARQSSSTGPAKIQAMPTQKHKPTDEELESISLVDEVEESPGAKKIRAFGVDAVEKQRQWKRKPTMNGRGAVRVRSFHGKMSDQGLGYLDDAINEWLDKNPEVEVKFVTSTVSVFEGKVREPALVLNLWY